MRSPSSAEGSPDIRVQPHDRNRRDPTYPATPPNDDDPEDDERRGLSRARAAPNGAPARKAITPAHHISGTASCEYQNGRKANSLTAADG